MRFHIEDFPPKSTCGGGGVAGGREISSNLVKKSSVYPQRKLTSFERIFRVEMMGMDLIKYTDTKVFVSFS